MNEYGMFAKELALSLEVNINTLRRWALELEKEGYIFSRNDKKQRIYYQHDILVLSNFQKIIGKTQSLENTAKAIVSNLKDKNNAEKMLGVIKDNSNNIVLTRDELDQLLSKVADEAVNRASEQITKAFKDALEQRDKNLLLNLTETIEQKQMDSPLINKRKHQGAFFRVFKTLFNGLEK